MQRKRREGRTGGGTNPQSSMEEGTGSPQEEVVYQLKRVSVEEAEFPSAREDDQSRHEGDQDMEPRVDEKRQESPTPSYLSMKSERSMNDPINFKKQEITEDHVIPSDRPESPTLSCLSMKSDHSKDLPINFKDKGSTETKGLCDPCSDVNIDTTAVKTCQTCSSSYCEKHVRRHYTEARFQTHILEEVAPAPQQRHYERFPVKRAVSAYVLPPPGEISILSVKSDSVTLTWGPPEGLEGPKKFRVTWKSGKVHEKLIVNDIHQVQITGLQPGQKYEFSVATQGDHGNHSNNVSATTCTVVTPPEDIKVDRTGATSIKVHWSKSPGMDHVPQRFLVTYSCPGSKSQAIHTGHCCTTLTDLQLSTQYSVEVCTVLSNGEQSQPALTTVSTAIPHPRGVKVVSVDTTSATVSWEQPDGMDQTQLQYQVSYQSPGRYKLTTKTSSLSITLSDLRPASEYSVSVCTEIGNKELSQVGSIMFNTKPTPPGNITINSYSDTSASLSWGFPSMEDKKYKFRVKWHSMNHDDSTIAEMGNANLTGLKANTRYSISVCTVDEHNKQESNLVCIELQTKLRLPTYIRQLGLALHAEEKLSMNTVVAIDGQMDNQASLLMSFLRKIMMLNVSARDLKFNPNKVSQEMMNPLDLITATFLCSDGFLQQDFAEKMSMCQFAVPLLLPNSQTQESTLMLWALRNIVKRFRPHSLDDKKGFVENSIVVSELPMVSFVRLNKSSLSKSQFLNEVFFSNFQQSHNNTFVHCNMTGGNVPRQISDGLVEISWYLPCGNPNIDVFPEPVAVANLRGDIQDFQTQFQFLCRTSSSVFIFCDDFDSDRILDQHMKTQPTIVCNPFDQKYNATSFEGLEKSALVLQRSTNNSDLVEGLRSKILEVIKTTPYKIRIEQMSSIAQSLKIRVDEDNPSCQNGLKAADVISGSAFSIPNFKDRHLPLQGLVKDLATIEREECKLQNLGKESIETYKSKLRKDKELIREKQVHHGVKDYMSHFITGLKSKHCLFFLRWLKIFLENKMRKHLSDLRKDYKENSQSDKTKLSDIEKQITRNSLGIEHFLREMGQLYESAALLPKAKAVQQNLKDLPEMCAQLMLDGIPLELMDGDASNIPLKWITDVLTKLHSLTQSNSKVRVITVLGVQSSGKSTLLNTMFGVQFAVSSGRCTRGAFMQLIRVEEDLKEQLDCDFIMVIDTEGLKAPELAQLVNSYEHDNELATLVVGLSDITIINVAMENAAEMKDTLQIVVHAFLRMKEVGKKPSCQFVYQNVADISAHNMNFKDRENLLQQLNEMTALAAQMERRKEIKKFSDIMIYDPEQDSWYFPGLWHGSPPMAPVNVGYSEAVNKLKKSIIQKLIDAPNTAHTLLEFVELTKSLWNAVSYENFIFSFRNSLEADAYTKLSVAFNKWEWAFREKIHVWLRESQTKISNHGKISPKKFNLKTLLKDLKEETISELDREEGKVVENLENYVKCKENRPNLLVKHKSSFIHSTQFLRKEIEASVMRNLETWIEIRENKATVETHKKNFVNIVLSRVRTLLKKCKRNKRKKQLSDSQLEQKFEETWRQSLQDLSVKELEKQDVDKDIHKELIKNLSKEAGFVNEMVKQINRIDEQGKGPFLGISLQDDERRCSQKEEESEAAKKIFRQSKRFLGDKVALETDYSTTDILNLLKTIDESFDQHPDLTKKFKASLKIHICGQASREFQQMHETFIRNNDPKICLEKFKPTYLADFKDRFHKREQSERKAEEFTNNCLEPAVRKCVMSCLGTNIISELVTNDANSMALRTRTFFQFDILKQLLEKDDSTQFVCYSKNYKSFVEKQILEHIVNTSANGSLSIPKLEESCLNKITERLEQAIKECPQKTDVCGFIKHICLQLDKDLVMPKDALEAVLALNNTTETEQFAECLTSSIREMKVNLKNQYHLDKDVRAKLEKVTIKPQDELFECMVGCGETCPFCRAPCEAAGRGHKEHFVTIHRPEGIGRYHWIK